ncbi:hypothetical protein KJZ63_02015 [Patescibacteria group bacterium]|nr:hypothetical protein [Patescibacteria group bacterium]
MSKFKKTSPKLNKLRLFYADAKNRFHKTHLNASQWLGDRGLDVEALKMAGKSAITATTLAGAVLTSQPVDARMAEKILGLNNKEEKLVAEVTLEEHEEIMNKMAQMVKMPPGHLNREDELYLEQQISDMVGFEVTAELDGHRLNHSIGIMGGEQHLKRFPTDSLAQHDEYQQAGIAPNRGAFGWFTENGELTQQAIQREKYYFAVQTLYLPEWNQNHDELKPWYKYRKMIAINPADGMAAVGVVGDAGPAQWVGKQFGGSPEIIKDAKIWSKEARGRVILFFVDDPEDKVPLGIVDLNQIKEQLAQAEAAS